LSVAGAPLPSKHIEETNQTKTLLTRSEAEWLGTLGRQPVKRSKLNYRKRSKYVNVVKHSLCYVPRGVTTKWVAGAPVVIL
jgi:hypothetical protein